MSDKNEQIARTIQLAIEGNTTEFRKKISYLVGNTTLKSLNLKSNTISGIASAEGARAIGTTTFKAVSDASRGDVVCTGLCLVATTCEGLAILAANVPAIPGRRRIYIISKSTSIGLMRFRNLCRNAKGQIGPC